MWCHFFQVFYLLLQNCVFSTCIVLSLCYNYIQRQKRDSLYITTRHYGGRSMLKNLITFFALLTAIATITAIIVFTAQTWFDPVALIIIVPFILITFLTVWFSNE